MKVFPDYGQTKLGLGLGGFMLS